MSPQQPGSNPPASPPHPRGESFGSRGPTRWLWAHSPSLTLGIGQQPYFPLGSWQQVEPSGHWDCPSGHKITARGERWAVRNSSPGWELREALPPFQPAP